MHHKIIQLWAPYKERGGEEVAVELTTKVLEQRHEVKLCEFQLDEILKKKFGKLRTLQSFYYNKNSVNKLSEMLDSFRPDVVIVHNIMPAGSLAIYRLLKRRGVPVIQYIHNYRPFSVSGYCWLNNQIESRGFKLNFLPEILGGSWRDSILQTGWYAMALRYAHFRGFWRDIDGWIAISNFTKEKFIEGGIDEEKIKTVYHPSLENKSQSSSKDYDECSPNILFLGRLSIEKGVQVLLDTWLEVVKVHPEAKLTIAGDGPLREEVIAAESQNESIEYLGFIDAKQKEEVILKQRAVVIPSLWWEGLGLVTYDAYSHSVPVIAACSGGLSEIVQDGKTGWTYDTNDKNGLKMKIIEALESSTESQRRGENGKKWLADNTNCTYWLDSVEEWLAVVIERSNINK